jgi:tetratricopeptide (TPR) repeat protein
MKRSVILTLAFLTWGQTLSAQPPEQMFQDGNRAFQQGKFQDAIAMYEKLLSTGYQSGEVFYNLGNAYYRVGNIGRAILFYERAARLIPDDDDLRHNLQLANLLIPDRIDPAPRLFIWQWWEAAKVSFSIASVTWLAYLTYLLVAVGVAVIVLARTYTVRRIGMLAALVSGVLLIVFGTLLVAKVAEANRADEAIVMVALATAKNSPDAKSSDAFVLHNGAKVLITDAVNEWMKVRLADGKVGWVEKGTLEVI